MLFKDVVTLIGITYNDEDVETIVNKDVFANKKSVRSSEFYQAQALGMKPELMFEVREYEGQTKLSYNGKEYNVIRSYSVNDEKTELVVQSVWG